MDRTAEAPAAPRRVAIFGGSFNPPHVGHLLATVYALAVAPIDEVLVVPVFLHPFSKGLVPYDDRLEMCRLAMDWLPGVTVSCVERDLGGESLTLNTVEHLAAAHPDWSLRLLIGSDVLADVPKWHRFDRIAELAPPIVLGRQGAGAPESYLPRISSTEIRAAFGRGDLEWLSERVPRPVLRYAATRGLYGWPAGGPELPRG